MTEDIDHNSAHRTNPATRPASARDHSPAKPVTSLRGADAVSVGRRPWLVAGVIGLLAFALVIVVSFISASNDNARIHRLKSHGIPVVVTVTYCVGNLGGSGSSGAGYTCHGKYSVGTTHFRELIGSKSTFSAPGAKVQGVADPSQPSTVVLASEVRTSAATSSAFYAPGLLAVILLVLTLAFIRVTGRAKRLAHLSDVDE